MQIGDTKRNGGFFDFQTDAATLRIYETSMRSNPVYAILKTVLSVVPATYWAYAAIDGNGVLSDVLSSDGTNRALDRLAQERALQRAATKIGPRIAATLVPLGDFESGVTLLFADGKSSVGILVLLRSFANGLFGSAELEMLAFALDTVSDRLAALALQRDGHADDIHAARPRGEHVVPEALGGAMYVLDREYAIVLAWQSPDHRGAAPSGLRTRSDVRLPVVLEEAVRGLTASWDAESPGVTGLAHPVPFLSVRATSLAGAIGPHIGVQIDRFRPAHSFAEAARRYNISAREAQVLTLLLDGRRLDEIGLSLHITTSTVQDHIRNMVGKTESCNRTELIAHVLGWEPARQAR